MKRLYLLFSVALVSNSLFSQDITKEVIKKVFYEKKVLSLVFFDYKGVGKWPHRLPDGVFAFIIPDSTFQKQYPNILYDLALSWAEEKMASTRTFIASPEGNMFINNNFLFDETIKLLIRFDQIRIDDTRAKLIFHTTSQRRYIDMSGRYVRIIASLKMGKKGWKIRHLKIKKIPCCDDFSATVGSSDGEGWESGRLSSAFI